MRNNSNSSIVDSRRLDKNKVIYDNFSITPSENLINWGKNKKFIIKTYGCQANVRDSEIIKQFLLKLEMKECLSIDEADFILFNTCAVRENAENHLYGDLGLSKKRLKSNPNLIVGICGCVMQEIKPVSFILEHFKFVSFIFGTNDIPSFYSLLKEALEKKKTIVKVGKDFNKVYENNDDLIDSRNSKYIAYVNIMYGCNKFCTYCIVPYTRGKERSRKKEDILNEIIKLKEKGYKQITLLGQNVNTYGKDLYTDYFFKDLLIDVSKTNIERIRFTTPYPSEFDISIFNVFKTYKNIMPSIHMPLQSGSNKVLKKMNRKYTKEEYLDLIYNLKKAIPNIFITTDIIVGFPNELEDDFLDTLEVVNKVEFDQAFTFIYSPRESTPASKMKNLSTSEEIKDRFLRLKKVVDDIALKKAKAMINSNCYVLFENVSKNNKDTLSGYNEFGKLVHVKYDKNLIGKIKKVKILSAKSYSLFGEIIDE